MSTTHPSAPATPAVYENRERIAPADLFDHFVFYSDEWCSACFQRIRRVQYTDADDGYSLGTGDDVLEDRRRVGTGWLGFDVEIEEGLSGCGEITRRDEEGRVTGVEPRERLGLARRHHPRTYCDECGANNGHAPDLPVSKREAVRRADQLVDCLLAQGVPVRRVALKDFVARAKSREQLRKREHDIYEMGVAHARRAYVRHCSD